MKDSVLIHKHAIITFAVTMLFSLFLSLMLSSPVTAEISCDFTQITKTERPVYNEKGVLSSDGSTIAVESNGNFTGNNPDSNPEVFLYDVGSESFDQTTNTTNPFRFVMHPSISSDGTRVAFQSEANITPPGLNPDENSQIYLYDSNTSTTSQISNIEFRGYVNSEISDNGSKVIFNQSGMRIADVSSLPFIYSRVPAGGGEASINSDGSLIAFASNASDIAPGNGDRNQEIFLYNTNTRRFTLITDTTTVENKFPRISSDGSHIVFISEGDLIGDNPDGSQEKFLYDVSARSFIQITDTTGPSRGYARNFTINADGSRVAYVEDSKILIFDKSRMDSFEIVESGHWPSINGDGTKIAFVSSLDLTGENPSRNREVFLAVCGEPSVPPSTPNRCSVRTLASPGGTINLPIPHFVPLCRCLEDRTIREFRCALFNPEFFMVFRFPSPIFPGKQFDMSLSFIPITKLSGIVSIDTIFPQNFKFVGKGSSGIKFPLSSPIDKAARANMQYLAPEQSGVYPLKATVLLPGKKGENLLDQEIEFNVPVVNQGPNK